jgi:hypothetical protein
MGICILGFLAGVSGVLKAFDASLSGDDALVSCFAGCCDPGFGFIIEGGFGRSFAFRMGAGELLLECCDWKMKKMERRASERMRALRKVSIVDVRRRAASSERERGGA